MLRDLLAEQTLNRTLLELKESNYLYLYPDADLSIVPYWNWKIEPKLQTKAGTPLNRTLLELKVGSRVSGDHTGNPLNRTLLELKVLQLYMFGDNRLTLNRTLLELKVVTSKRLLAVTRSQSYLIGIESGYEFACVVPQNVSQSYLIGIESDRETKREHRARLSIVPYWNWKRVPPCYAFRAKGLSIVPYWNWKSFNYTCSETTGSLSIVPYWNWKLWRAKDY